MPALFAGAALAIVVALVIVAWPPRSSEIPPRVSPPASSGAQPAPAEAPRSTRVEATPEVWRALTAIRARLLDALRAPNATAPEISTPDEPPEEAAAAVSTTAYDPRHVLDQLGEGALPLLRPCYEAALARHPGLAGHLVLLLEIESDPVSGGFVEEAEFTDESDIDDPEMRACVRESLLALTFDTAPAPAGLLTMKYPIDFTP